MAAAAGKKCTTSLSWFNKAFGFAVEEDLSTVATQTWAAGREQGEAWLNQVIESDVETSDRACRSGDVRDSRLGH